jgi:hypothetical protein
MKDLTLKPGMNSLTNDNNEGVCELCGNPDSLDNLLTDSSKFYHFECLVRCHYSNPGSESEEMKAFRRLTGY